MKKRVAIPIVNDKLSEYFGQCGHYQIFEIEGEVIHHQKVWFPAGTEVPALPVWLEKMGITDVITYKIDPKIIHLFASKKINLFVGVTVDSPENLIEAYQQGKLESDDKIIKEITIVTER